MKTAIEVAWRLGVLILLATIADELSVLRGLLLALRGAIVSLR